MECFYCLWNASIACRMCLLHAGCFYCLWNVSVACGCLLFQLAERRRAFLGGGDLSIERQDAFFKEWQLSEQKKKQSIAARQSIAHRVDGKA